MGLGTRPRSSGTAWKRDYGLAWSTMLAKPSSGSGKACQGDGQLIELVFCGRWCLDGRNALQQVSQFGFDASQGDRQCVYFILCFTYSIIEPEISEDEHPCQNKESGSKN